MGQMGPTPRRNPPGCRSFFVVLLKFLQNPPEFLPDDAYYVLRGKILQVGNLSEFSVLP